MNTNPFSLIYKNSGIYVDKEITIETMAKLSVLIQHAENNLSAMRLDLQKAFCDKLPQYASYRKKFLQESQQNTQVKGNSFSRQFSFGSSLDSFEHQSMLKPQRIQTQYLDTAQSDKASNLLEIEENKLEIQENLLEVQENQFSNHKEAFQIQNFQPNLNNKEKNKTKSNPKRQSGVSNTSNVSMKQKEHGWNFSTRIQSNKGRVSIEKSRAVSQEQDPMDNTLGIKRWEPTSQLNQDYQQTCEKNCFKNFKILDLNENRY